jgi:serine/threonine-protein kinase
MKFVEGRDLDDIIKKSGQLPIATVKDILVKVGSALGYAHRRNVVHRDIKPGNVMIDEEGTPIVTDFGIAKVAETSGLTMTGTTIGTPSYMSPEQCEAKEVTGASDQYSLGILAFEMLTGKIPFEGESAVTTMYKQCHEALPPLEDFRPDCPPEILDTVNRMLAKAPGDRWPTMEAAIQKLSSSTTSGTDPVHSELVALARETGSEELLARLSDPVPAAEGTGVSGGQATAKAASAPAKRSRAIAAGVALVALVGAGTLAITRPWAADTGEALRTELETEPVADAASPEEGQTGSELVAGVDEGNSGETQGGDVEAAAGDDGGSTQQPVENTEDAAEERPETPPPAPQYVVASVSVGGVTGSLEVGQNARLSATAQDTRGQVVPQTVVDQCGQYGWARCGVVWVSSDETVLTVAGDGVVRAIAPGRATVTATVDRTQGSTSVSVSAVAVAQIQLTPSSLIIEMEQDSTISAQARSSSGEDLGSVPLGWVSSSPAVAEVDASSGVVRGRRPGQASITASVDGASASVSVEVRPNLEAVVRVLIERWTDAFESGNVGRLREVMRGQLAPELERGVEGLGAVFRNARDLDAELSLSSLERDGEEAVAAVVGFYRWEDRTAGAQEFPASLEFQLRRGPEGWRPVRASNR